MQFIGNGDFCCLILPEELVDIYYSDVKNKYLEAVEIGKDISIGYLY
jgi:hypothetical protein